MDLQPGTTERPVRARTTLLVRYLPYVILLGLVVVLVRVAWDPVTNPDTFFHLRFGQEFLHGWSLWHPGSVTRFATRPWVPTQWLGEILIATFGGWFGLAGVAWLTGVFYLGYVLALFLATRAVCSMLPAALLTVLAAVASGDGFSGRPQMFSYILIVVVLDAWRRTSQDGRPRWWLLAVAWVWPLLHGMWILGLVLSVVAAVGIAVDRRTTMSRRERRLLLALPAGMAVLSALTPIGPKIFPAVLVVGARGSYYSEWAPTDFHRPTAITLAVLLVIVLGLRIRTGSAGWYLTLVTLLTCGYAVYSQRTVPVAAAMAALLAAQAVGEQGFRDPRGLLRDGRLAVGGVLAGLVVLALAVPHTASRPEPHPAWLTQEVGSLPAGTGVLCFDTTGAYLMWRYPQVDVLMHGYGDTFTTAELARNRDLVTLSPGWENLLHRTGIRVAVLPPNSGLATALAQDNGWSVVHQSSTLEYLRAPPGWGT